MMAVTKLHTENFEQEILRGKGIALVDFYADWCGPCRMVAPVVEAIAQERTDITVGKINVDESPDIAVAFQVMNIPTLIVFRDGKEADRIIGYRPKEEILALLK